MTIFKRWKQRELNTPDYWMKRICDDYGTTIYSHLGELYVIKAVPAKDYDIHTTSTAQRLEWWNIRVKLKEKE